MTKYIGIGLLAVVTTASMASANGGEGEKKSPNGDPNVYQSQPVSFKPGSGITFDGGDEFMLKWTNRLQLQFYYVAEEFGPDEASFRVRRARSNLSGHVFNKNIQYKFQIDAADAIYPVKDAWVHWRFLNNENSSLGLRMGQGKTYFGLEATGSSAYLEFVERGLAAHTFSDVRTQGAWLFGSYMENKLRWNAGIQNGDVANAADAIYEVGEETSNGNNKLSYVLNVSFDPLGDYTGGKTNESIKQSDVGHTEDLLGTIGAGVFFGNGTYDDPTVGNATQDSESLSFNVNTAWRVKGFHAMGDFFYRMDDTSSDVSTLQDETSIGWQLQASYTLPKSGDSSLQWGFGARVSGVTLDDANGGAPQWITGTSLGNRSGDIMTFEAGVNAFYHEHSAKTQLTYRYESVKPDGAGAQDETNHAIALMLTLIF